MAQLRQGMSTERVSWTISLGIVFGVFPIMGSTSLVCILVAWAFRLNQALLHVFKAAVYPLHLALILVFIRLGERLYGVPLIKFSIPELLGKFKDDPLQFARDFWHGGVARRQCLAVDRSSGCGRDQTGRHAGGEARGDVFATAEGGAVMNAWTLFATGAGLMAVVFVVAWAMARRWNNYSLVDAVWAFGIGLTGILWLAARDSWSMKHWVACGLLVSWSLRLGWHLQRRIRKAHPEEDARYAKLREVWTGREATAFFWFFQSQAISVVLLALPFLRIALDADGSWSAWETAGCASRSLGFVAKDWRIPRCPGSRRETMTRKRSARMACGAIPGIPTTFSRRSSGVASTCLPVAPNGDGRRFTHLRRSFSYCCGSPEFRRRRPPPLDARASPTGAINKPPAPSSRGHHDNRSNLFSS